MGRRKVRRIACLVAALALLGAAPAPAAIGDLSPAQCFSVNPRPGCSQGPTVQPENYGVTVAPNGRRAYLAGGEAIAVYNRNPVTQELTYLSCIGFSSGGNCTAWPEKTLFFPTYLGVSPDSRFVYAFGQGAYAFEVTDAGLKFASCLHFDLPVWGGCPQEPLLEQVIDGELSPDGSTLYVTTHDEGTWRLLTLTRSQTDGSMDVVSCISQQSQPGCAPVSASGALHEPSDIVISPDGRSLYVASGDTLDVFSRDTGTGALTFAQCVGNRTGATVGCGPQNDLFAGLRYLDVSPDGRNVYASDPEDPAVATFVRDPDSGLLSDMTCFGHANACTEPWTASDTHATIRVTPRGRHVFTVGNIHQPTLTQYNRTAEGRLIFKQCWSSANRPDCTAEPRLDGVRGLAMSPDSFSVLTSAREPAHTLTHWRLLDGPHCDETAVVTAVSGQASTLKLPCTGIEGIQLTAADVIDGPAHGNAVGSNDPGTITYTATAGYTGEDTLTYSATNAIDTTGPWALKILVGPASGVPVCQSLSRTIAHGAPTTFQLTCAAPAGQTATLRVGTPPSGGTLGPISETNTITYTPDPGFEGTDEFTYIGRDVDGDSVPATIRITVNAAPRALVTTPLTACGAAGELLLLRADCGEAPSTSWNAPTAGPPGPKGPPGADTRGPAGPRGPAGTFRWPALRTVITSWAIRGDRLASGESRCGPEEVAIGGAVTGGYHYDGPRYDPPWPDGLWADLPEVNPNGPGTVYASHPLGGMRGWYGRVRGRNEFYVIAYCLRAR